MLVIKFNAQDDWAKAENIGVRMKVKRVQLYVLPSGRPYLRSNMRLFESWLLKSTLSTQQYQDGTCCMLCAQECQGVL